MFFRNTWNSLKKALGPAAGSRAALRTAARFADLSQAQYLRHLLQAQRDTAYGLAHGFGKIDSIAAYQTQVPMVDYEILRPWLAEIEQGKVNVLTAEPVVAMRQSAGGSQRLPVTENLQNEMAAALRPFLGDWLSLQPELADQPWYWESLADDDAAALGPVPLLPAASLHPARLMGGSVGKRLRGLFVGAPKRRTRGRFALLVQLLEKTSLAALSLGDPTQALATFELLQTHLPELLRQLPPNRRRQVAELATQGTLTAKALWPQLTRVSIWRDGVMAPAAAALEPFFTGIAWQTAPLHSAAAMLTVPELQAAGTPVPRGAPLAIDSHFFEFIDLQAPRQTPRLAHQLEVGGVYLPVVSTAGGLYRFVLDDVVECTGYWEQVPRLAFVDKMSRRRDLAGENLSAADLQLALQRAAGQAGVVYRSVQVRTVGGNGSQPNYVFDLDTDAADAELLALSEAIDAALCRLPAYWARRSQELLGAVGVVRQARGLDPRGPTCCLGAEGPWGRRAA